MRFFPFGSSGTAASHAASSAPVASASGGGPLASLVAAGAISAGVGVLKVHWWGVELPPAANLSASGDITLPEGVGEAGATYTVHSLLTCLAKRNRLFGFSGTSDSGAWSAVSYGGRRLSDLRSRAP